MRALALPLAAVLGLAVPLAAQGSGEAEWAEIDGKRVDLARERAAIEQFQSFDQRLQNVGWKLVRGNAEFCDRVIPSIGLQLQDMASYGSPSIARAALGLTRDFAVQTAARGSPAALSGALTANREIARLAWADPNEWEAGKRMDWQRLVTAHDLLDHSLERYRMVEIRFADGGKAIIEPVDVCATRFELMGSGERAVADGERVVIGIEFPAFAYEEPVFAGVVAHELAHNLLGHRAWLSNVGRKQRTIRRAEREADRLMPWIMANAGYDPAAAQEFMERWGPGNDGWIFRDRSHDGWDERAEFIAAEIPQIRAPMASEGKADWSVHFEREIDPARGADQFDRD